jgi:hypothetical protein
VLLDAAHDTSARDEALPDLVKVEPRRPQSQRGRRRCAESADLGRDRLIEGVAERIGQQKAEGRREHAARTMDLRRTRAEALSRPLQRLVPAGASETEGDRFKSSREDGCEPRRQRRLEAIRCPAISRVPCFAKGRLAKEPITSSCPSVMRGSKPNPFGQQRLRSTNFPFGPPLRKEAKKSFYERGDRIPRETNSPAFAVLR